MGDSADFFDLVVRKVQQLEIYVELERCWEDLFEHVVLQEEVLELVEELKVLNIRPDIKEGQS